MNTNETLKAGLVKTVANIKTTFNSVAFQRQRHRHYVSVHCLSFCSCSSVHALASDVGLLCRWWWI